LVNLLNQRNFFRNGPQENLPTQGPARWVVLKNGVLNGYSHGLKELLGGTWVGGGPGPGPGFNHSLAPFRRETQPFPFSPGSQLKLSLDRFNGDKPKHGWNYWGLGQVYPGVGPGEGDIPILGSWTHLVFKASFPKPKKFFHFRGAFHGWGIPKTSKGGANHRFQKA